MSLFRDRSLSEDKLIQPQPILAKLSPSKVFVTSILAGGVTGAINISIIYPTEFIKTQLQLDQGRKVYRAHSTIIDLTQRNTKYKYRATQLLVDTIKNYNGSKDVIKKTVSNKGLTGLYKGCSVLLMGAIPMYAVRFGSFEALKNRFSDKNGQLSMMGRFGCGLAAGVAEAVLVVTWTETLKV